MDRRGSAPTPLVISTTPAYTAPAETPPLLIEGVPFPFGVLFLRGKRMLKSAGYAPLAQRKLQTQRVPLICLTNKAEHDNSDSAS